VLGKGFLGCYLIFSTNKVYISNPLEELVIPAMLGGSVEVVATM